MTNGKTLYITDLDGTLLNRDKEISDYSRSVINALIAEGGNFTVASARTVASAVKILSELNLSLPVVLMNGAVVYDLQQEKFDKIEAIEKQTAKAIIEVMREQNASGFMYAISGNKQVTYYENLSTRARKDFHDERVKKYQKLFEQTGSFLDKLVSGKTVYFTLIDEYEPLAGLSEEFKKLEGIDMELYRDVYSKDLWFLEVFSHEASKYNAVQYLRRQYGFDRVIGFGDNFNDIPLLKACDEGYAVANAVEALKEKATEVIGDNDADGVARFISKREGT